MAPKSRGRQISQVFQFHLFSVAFSMAFKNSPQNFVAITEISTSDTNTQ